MSTYRILVADELAPEGMAILEEAADVTIRTGMDEDALREALPPYHALVVRSATKPTARSLELAENLTVIGRAGIGIDNIDLKAATERGIVVMNTPEANAVTTGELALSLMMSLARNIAAADASMKAGRWDKKQLIGTELRGQRLGVLGLGKIGTVVATRALGLKMHVGAFDPNVSQEDAPEGVRMVTLDELLERSDFLTVHVPLNDHTRHLLNAERLAKMKKGARLIHAARGGVVDDNALIEALESGHLSGAALDVYETEPLPEDHPFRSMANVVLTPHLGASTNEAKRNVSIEMARQIVTCLQTGVALNGVNVPRIPPSEVNRLAPFLALSRNLASFLVQIFPGKLESLRLTCQGELPEMATQALSLEMLGGALNVLADRPVTPVNAEAIAESMGVRVHSESSTLKRDFLNLIRIEALVDGERHFITGTVLGNRHGRMVQLDKFLLDAIPEGPLLVIFHHDKPGVIGAIGSILGDENVNISRLQLGAPPNGGPALGILNLSTPVEDGVLQRIRDLASIDSAYAVVA